MWFTIGFACVTATCAYLYYSSWLIVFAVLLAMIATVLLLRSGENLYQKIAGVILIGCAAGFLWFFIYDGLYLNSARQYDAKSVKCTVEITDFSYETNYGVAANGKVVLKNKSYTTCVYLASSDALQPGDRITGTMRFRYTAIGGSQEPTYHQGKGIYFLAFADEDAEISLSTDSGVMIWVAKLRHWILNTIDAVFPEDTAGFARALLLGDAGKLTYETDTAFKVSGIRHVIAVSGLHVSILFSLIYMLSGRRRYLTAILGLPLLFLFAAIAGFTPSVVRACVMQGLVILAIMLNREYDPPTALGLAVLIMLIVNPMTITSVSFQLSVGCMAGIFLFSERIRKFLLRDKCLGSGKGKSIKARLTRWFAGSISISLSAMIITTPLSIAYFQMVSVVGILTNLLVLWVISFAFYGIMLACFLASFWLWAAKAVGFLIAYPIRYVLWVADLLSSIPFAAIYTNTIYTQVWVACSYIMLALFLIIKRKKPMILLTGILVGMFLSVGAAWLEPKLDNYRLTVLDVGQGQCVLFQSDGRNYLVDCGGDYAEQASDVAAQTLLSQGITRLDGIILTHYDKDHIGGVLPLLTRVKADTLYLPNQGMSHTFSRELSKHHSSQIQSIEENTVLSYGDVTISLFPALAESSDNESSMCILFQTENCDILITGDRTTKGERDLLRQGTLPQLEILILGHHGSKTSTSFELLDATRPTVAAISVGANNRYGHPAELVLERLNFFGCHIRRTDLEGTIIFRG